MSNDKMKLRRASNLADLSKNGQNFDIGRLKWRKIDDFS